MGFLLQQEVNDRKCGTGKVDTIMQWDRLPISFLDKGETEEIAKERQRFNRYPPKIHTTRDQ